MFIIFFISALIYSALAFGGVYAVYGIYSNTFYVGYIFGIAVLIMNGLMSYGMSMLHIENRKKIINKIMMFKSSAVCGIIILLFGVACMYIPYIPFALALIIEIILAFINTFIMFINILHSDKP